jgi:class 3 adenylate cyclase
MHCAIEWQRGMAERHAGEQADGRLEFRIGVNVGDVVIDGDDIFGDGVAEILTETSRRKARDLAGQALETDPLFSLMWPMCWRIWVRTSVQ